MVFCLEHLEPQMSLSHSASFHQHLAVARVHEVVRDLLRREALH